MGVTFDNTEKKFVFDFKHDGTEDIVSLTGNGYQVEAFGKCFYYGYEFSEQVESSVRTAFIKYVKEIVSDCGFAINEKKIRLYGPKGNKILTGISLANGQPRVPRDFRRRLEKDLFYIRKYGIDAHINHMKIRRYNYLESIMGQVDFWCMVEPGNSFASEMSAYLHSEYKKRLQQ